MQLSYGPGGICGEVDQGVWQSQSAGGGVGGSSRMDKNNHGVPFKLRK